MQLYHRRFGDSGEPLVLLHGLFGNHGNWAGHARELAQDFSVFTLDLRNHGRSGWSDAHDYPAMADDLAETLDTLHLDSVHLLGHSMGGKAAMAFALQHADRVRKLVVADIAPVTYPDEDWPPLAALNAVDLPTLESRQQAAEVMAGYLESQAVIDFLLTNLQKEKDGRFGWRCNLQTLTRHYPQIKGWPAFDSRYEGPVLFIGGGDSGYITEAARKPIQELFPSAGLKLIGGAGHWLHSEKPRAFLKIVRDFLLSA